MWMTSDDDLGPACLKNEECQLFVWSTARVIVLQLMDLVYYVKCFDGTFSDPYLVDQYVLSGFRDSDCPYKGVVKCEIMLKGKQPCPHTRHRLDIWQWNLKFQLLVSSIFSSWNQFAFVELGSKLPPAKRLGQACRKVAQVVTGMNPK